MCANIIKNTGPRLGCSHFFYFIGTPGTFPNIFYFLSLCERIIILRYYTLRIVAVVIAIVFFGHGDIAQIVFLSLRLKLEPECPLLLDKVINIGIFTDTAIARSSHQCTFGIRDKIFSIHLIFINGFPTVNIISYLDFFKSEEAFSLFMDQWSIECIYLIK